MNRIQIPVILLLMTCCGCNLFGLQSDSSSTQLQISGIMNLERSDDISVWPESVPRDPDRILHANLQARKDPVFLRELFIGIQTAATVSEIITDASLVYNGEVHPLDRVVDGNDSTGFLVFKLPRSESAIREDSRSLEVRARFKPSAHGSQVRARIGAEARRRTKAVRSNGALLATDQKTGSARGTQYSLRRVGAYADLKNMSVAATDSTVMMKTDIAITAFAADVSMPLRGYQSDGSGMYAEKGGFHYQIQDPSGLSATTKTLATTLESTTQVSSQGSFAPIELAVKEGETQTLSLTVRYHPGRQAVHCLHLDRLKYQLSDRFSDNVAVAKKECARIR